MPAIPRSRSRRRKWIAASAWAVAGLAALVAASVAGPFIEASRYSLKGKTVPADALAGQPGLVYALKRYEIGGSHYKWGQNDCSTFVTDYLRALARPAYPRLTTRDLYEPAAMQWNGFIQTNLAALKPGDIIVFRYTGRYHTLQGHTGIVVRHGNALYVVHNSLSHGGIQFEELGSFVERANRIADKTPSGKMVRFFTSKGAT
ncbi:MAG: CHAP domain-containing protein [Armatimonadetes bacterium]|nr:CHAP domain-containing protein [Armatimonadota bacterium]MBS1711059.1 CHAP domain-containing protein [Armatimonadota bacterium]MBX3108731.1 CHAP domain-containing protein [Fimbriimonadaceae bacterium]